MFSFLSNKKPRRYNYKPQYDETTPDKEEQKDISFREKKYTDAMYDRFDRNSFTEIKKAGRRSLMIKMFVLTVILIVLIMNIDELEAFLKKLQ